MALGKKKKKIVTALVGTALAAGLVAGGLKVAKDKGWKI